MHHCLLEWVNSPGQTKDIGLSWVWPGQGWFSLQSRKGHSQAGWPHLAKQSRVFHTMCRHAGFWWGGSWGAGIHSRLGSAQQRCGLGERLCGLCGLCCVFSLSVLLLLLFPLFAVLLNCPYPDPPFSACFFPFSSAPRRGEGWPHGAFVAGCSQTRTRTFCDRLILTQTQIVHPEDRRIYRWEQGLPF